MIVLYIKLTLMLTSLSDFHNNNTDNHNNNNNNNNNNKAIVELIFTEHLNCIYFLIKELILL